VTVTMYNRYPLSLRQVEDLVFERGIDFCHETVRFWWNRFGPVFTLEIRRTRTGKPSCCGAVAPACGRGLCDDQSKLRKPSKERAGLPLSPTIFSPFFV
jgi:hypothetical protein